MVELSNMKVLTLNSPMTMSSSNKFTGRLPLGMKVMRDLETLYVNVPTLSGPIPDFTRASGLTKCDFTIGDYCREWQLPVKPLACDFDLIPMCNPDCMILYEFFGSSPGRCCSSPVAGITCNEDERIIAMLEDFINQVVT
jgi:hypothetical protein